MVATGEAMTARSSAKTRNRLTADKSARHLLHVFPTFAVGGSQSRFLRLVGLHGRRYRHTVMSIDGDLAMATRLPPGTDVQTLRAPHCRSSTEGIIGAWRTLKEIKPDVLVTYNWGAMDWAIAKRFR